MGKRELKPGWKLVAERGGFWITRTPEGVFHLHKECENKPLTVGDLKELRDLLDVIVNQSIHFQDLR